MKVTSSFASYIYHNGIQNCCFELEFSKGLRILMSNFF